MTEARFATGARLDTDKALTLLPPAREQAAADHAGRGADDLDFVGLLRLLWAGKWALLLLTVCAGVAAAAYVHLATPLYTAASRIVLETEQKTVVDLEGIISKNPAEQQAMKTELLVLRSRELMTIVAQELRLDRDPEFNPALRRPHLWRRLVNHVSTLRTRGLGPWDASRRGSDRSLDATVDTLQQKVRASIVPNTYAFQVAVETRSPEKSAAIANAIAERYIKNQRTQKLDAMEQALAWLSDRVVDLKQELETAEAKTEEYASNASTANEQALAATMRKLQSMRRRLDSQSALADKLRARFFRLQRLRQGGNFALLSETAGDPRLRALAGDLIAAPKDARLLADFDARLADMAETLRQDTERSESQAAAIAAAVAEFETKVEQQSSDLVNLRQLRREAEATRLLYEHFLARMKEISVQQGVQQADSRLLSPAKVPTRASSPRAGQTILLGSLGGLILAIGLVLLRDRFRATVQSPEELEAVSGEGVIGVLPETAARQSRQLVADIIDKPGHSFAEAVRNLRASICLSKLDAAPKVIMLTSSEPEEGKSTIAATLALTSAMAGRRVLLVDGDLRRRAIGEIFDSAGECGLVSVLNGECSPEDATFNHDPTGMDVLFAENHHLSSGALFESSRFDFFIRDMRKKYDLVVIDTPPVLFVPDARVIGQSADAVVYVVRWNATLGRMVRTGLELLRQVSLPITGVALTRVDVSTMGQYGYYGYGEGRRARKFRQYYAA